MWYRSKEDLFYYFLLQGVELHEKKKNTWRTQYSFRLIPSPLPCHADKLWLQLSLKAKACVSPIQSFFFFSLVSLYPTITFCLRWLDEEFVLIGLVSPSTCHSTMCKKEHLFKVSKSPLAVLKLHFINSEEQLTMMLFTCFRQIHQRRGESMLACGWQWDYKRMNSKRKLLRFD